jgi:hypothetical protein
MAEDRAGRADTRPAQRFGPETVFAPCQRREHHLLSSSSIRGFLTSGLPKLAVDADPSYSPTTPANARVQGLGAMPPRLRCGIRGQKLLPIPAQRQGKKDHRGRMRLGE